MKQKKIDQWSKFYDRQISEEEYKEICDNLRECFNTLQEWGREGAESDKNKS